MYGVSKDCLILISFRLPQISCSILSLKCFSSYSDNCLDVGIEPLLQFSHLTSRSSLTKTPVFPASSFLLLSCAWFYIFFSVGQVLLFALSWCSACTSVSEGVFPDGPMERDVLHVHLLLCHLVLPRFLHFKTFCHLLHPILPKFSPQEPRNSLQIILVWLLYVFLFRLNLNSLKKKSPSQFSTNLITHWFFCTQSTWSVPTTRLLFLGSLSFHHVSPTGETEQTVSIEQTSIWMERNTEREDNRFVSPNTVLAKYGKTKQLRGTWDVQSPDTQCPKLKNPKSAELMQIFKTMFWPDLHMTTSSFCHPSSLSA